MKNLSPIFNELIADQIIACTVCGGDLEHRVPTRPHLFCKKCSTVFPVLNGVSLLMPPTSLDDLGEELCRNIGFRFEFDDLLLAFGSAAAFELRDPALRGEFANIRGRFRLGQRSETPQIAARFLGSAGIGYVRHYCSPELPVASTVYRTIRVCNLLTHSLTSDGIHPFHVSYHLYSADGTLLAFEGLRS